MYYPEQHMRIYLNCLKPNQVTRHLYGLFLSDRVGVDVDIIHQSQEAENAKSWLPVPSILTHSK